MSTVNVYDTKPYDREHLQAAGAGKVDWRFFEFRLTPESATTARGVDSVCVFVNDELSRPCLETLAACGVKHIALRCAGYNNVDLARRRISRWRSRGYRLIHRMQWPSTRWHRC